jgi:hypothetical protein
MAKKKDDAAVDAQVAELAQPEAQEESVSAPLVRAVLNPATQLGAYGFEDGFSAFAGEIYALSEEEFERYSKIKHRGKQVLIKA